MERYNHKALELWGDGLINPSNYGLTANDTTKEEIGRYIPVSMGEVEHG